MEYHVTLTSPMPEPGPIEDAIRVLDPAALVDIDPATPTLRIATSINARDLLALLVAQAGLPIGAAQVRQLPSTCCGGCSG